MTKDEALKLALEALETELAVDMTNGAEVGEAAELMCEAITAIKQARSTPVQENTMIYKTFEQWKNGNVLEHGVPRTEHYSEDQFDLVEMGWNYGYDAGRAVEQALDKKAENARELGLDYEPHKGLSEHLAQTTNGRVRIDPVTGDVGIGTAPAQPALVQEPVEVDQATMELAESVGLIGPASRTHDLHAAIQRFHDLICVNATIKAAKMAADAIRESTPPTVPVAWKWHQAPVKTSWGHDMVVADLAIDKDNTVSVYCERDQTAKVEAMFTPPAAQPAVPDAFGTREGEHPQYVQGWNDCRAEMLRGKP